MLLTDPHEDFSKPLSFPCKTLVLKALLLYSIIYCIHFCFNISLCFDWLWENTTLHLYSEDHHILTI